MPHPRPRAGTPPPAEQARSPLKPLAKMRIFAAEAFSSVALCLWNDILLINSKKDTCICHIIGVGHLQCYTPPPQLLTAGRRVANGLITQQHFRTYGLHSAESILSMDFSSINFPSRKRRRPRSATMRNRRKNPRIGERQSRQFI